MRGSKSNYQAQLSSWGLTTSLRGASTFACRLRRSFYLMTCDVRLWHKADIPTRTTTSAFGGEADVPSTDLIDAKRASAPPTRQCASLRRYEPLIREVH